ncbi:type II secretion system protein [Pedosphaera parvula]|uniref:type II secretion system protein n=1 Tax=Pedosphaera parvula TaxID=1032527 RepID=UPI000A032011|nr:prepilin-type N-terminal cleavage/methylation domain-containing protein [Pedosphaera parvula]
MKRNHKAEKGFTLVELLVVVGVIAVLAALLVQGLKGAQNKARQTACLNNLRQISLAVHQYIDDSLDQTPRTPGTRTNWTLTFHGYKKLIESYVGTDRESPLRTRLFACPADTFYYGVSNGYKVLITQSLHAQPFTDYESYGFNAGNLRTNLGRFGIDYSRLGISGRKLSSIKNPATTILTLEAPASDPFSWHQPRMPLSLSSTRMDERFNDAMNMIGFVDGHVSYIKIYWSDTTTNGASLGACDENPPPEYGYQWSGD